MTLGKNIAALRKAQGMTQEALANALGVTNQAVSKWELDTCCPDIQLLPRLANLFGVSLDTLFGRETRVAEPAPVPILPWEDDGVLRAVIYVGHNLILGHPAGERIEFSYEGPALNVHSEFSVFCDDVAGNIHAAGNVTCDDVDGNVNAGQNVTCDSVDGSVSAGRDVTCDEICGGVQAGRDVRCDHAEGTVVAGGAVYFG